MTAIAPHWPAIHKDIAALPVLPNLVDYDRARATFSWSAARAQLDGLPGGRGLNIAYEAVDRHVAAGRGDRVALRWLGREGARRDVSYAQLSALSSRFAHALEALGVERGERVFAVCDRRPELFVAALGTLKRGAVFCPLFSAFGPEPLRQRLALGDARAVVTTPALYERRLAGLPEALPGLEHVLLAGDELDALLAAQASSTRSPRPIRRSRRCCISRAARPAPRRALCTSMRRSSRIMRRARSRWICTRTMCIGARPTRAG
jgi:acyl-CoA synthetase (AMP-forming)/AMP-acid ligase II